VLTSTRNPRGGVGAEDLQLPRVGLDEDVAPPVGHRVVANQRDEATARAEQRLDAVWQLAAHGVDDEVEAL
jgi:hypothetical protein